MNTKFNYHQAQDVKRAMNEVLKDLDYFKSSRRLEERGVRGSRLPSKNRNTGKGTRAVTRPVTLPRAQPTGPRRDLTLRGKDGGDTLSSASAAYSRGFSSQKPQFNLTNDGIRIRKRELLSSVTGSVNFAIANSYALNPGVASSFPWLSTQAAGWEQYKFHKLKYCYYTRTGTSTPGSVILVPDYDAADAAPTSEIQAMDYKDAKEEVPWVVEFCCDLNPKAMFPNGGTKFIRQGTVPNTDIKTYDAGNFFAITTDGTAVNWGKLFVEYDVELSVAQQSYSSPTVATGFSTTSTTANALAGMVYTAAAPGGLMMSGSANTITFTGIQNGTEYLVTYLALQSTGAVLQFSTLTGGTVVTNGGASSGNGGPNAYTFTGGNSGTATLVVALTSFAPPKALLAVAAIPTPSSAF